MSDAGRMTLRSKTLALALSFAVLVAALTVFVRADEPAAAAVTGAGYSGITPYGGYLGNYIAPDGACVSKCTLEAAPRKAAHVSGPSNGLCRTERPVNVGDMDELLHAIIESERYWDGVYEGASWKVLAPVSILSDGEGGTVEVYADGSYCTKLDGDLV